MRIERIDLYLLHWRGGARIEETFEAFHRLREAGKIGDFGVSNFDRDDMEDAARLDKRLDRQQPGALLPVPPRSRVRPVAVDAQALASR